MSKPIMIEKAKNVSIVVLFLSTVLLLYFFWGNITFDDLKQPAVPVAGEVPETPYLIRPERVIVNFGSFGSDNYAVIPAGQSDVWCDQTETDRACMVKELDRFGQAENILVNEITYAKYQEVMKYRSIWAEFNYDIPMADFCRNFGIKKAQSFDSIETVTAIGYSAASEDAKKSLFIFDRKNLKYYRLYSEKDNTQFGSLIDTIEIDTIESERYNIYYPISTYLGVDNNTLVPVTVKSDLISIPFRQAIYSYQSEKINEIAKAYFGGNFDFVRKVTEDKGTVIYMYGYGQIVLIINTDGSIEYKEEQVSDNSGQSLLDALNTAVQFVADHGSWSFPEEAKLTPYLKDVVLDPGKEHGYQFVFGLEVNGIPLYYEQGDPITVNVIKGQVTYYKRDLIDFDEKDLEEAKADSMTDVFSTVNLIAQNYQYIYDILLKAGTVNTTADQEAMFEDVASLVDNMQIGYVKLAVNKSTELQPAWIVTFKNTNVFFDLYTAEPIGYSIK
ncbi:MAG: hypothetical protein AAGU75_03015 [Bacillota bacterium]